jgi:thiol-disulfide isomerase/thioredoxin
VKWLRRRWKESSLGAAGIAAAALWIASADGPGGQVLAPRFVAWSIDSTPVQRSLNDFAGHPILLNVWATWCDPCREEMPSLERLYRDYGPRGLRIVAVSIDDRGNEDLIREFVREHDLTFDILHDPKGSIMPLYLVVGVPQTFLIARDRRIIATRYVADWSSPSSRALVDSLMRAG